MTTHGSQIPRYQTSIRTNGQGKTVVTLYTTPIVKFDDGEVVLDTGGWRTRTTKVRMNQVSSHYGLGLRVFQRDFEWYVQFKDKEIPFETERLQIDRKTGAFEQLE